MNIVYEQLRYEDILKAFENLFYNTIKIDFNKPADNPWEWNLSKHYKFPHIIKEVQWKQGVFKPNGKFEIKVEGDVFKSSENSNDILDKKSIELASNEINKKYGKEIAKDGEVSLVYEEEFLKLYDFYYDKLTEGE